MHINISGCGHTENYGRPRMWGGCNNRTVFGSVSIRKKQQLTKNFFKHDVPFSLFSLCNPIIVDICIDNQSEKTFAVVINDEGISHREYFLVSENESASYMSNI